MQSQRKGRPVPKGSDITGLRGPSLAQEGTGAPSPRPGRAPAPRLRVVGTPPLTVGAPGTAQGTLHPEGFSAARAGPPRPRGCPGGQAGREKVALVTWGSKLQPQRPLGSELRAEISRKWVFFPLIVAEPVLQLFLHFKSEISILISWGESAGRGGKGRATETPP